MTAAQVQAWVSTAAGLAAVGVQVAGLLKGWMGQAHPNLTPDELHNAYEAIIQDDTVRAAFAHQAAGG